jgi:hypothetical protein
LRDKRFDYLKREKKRGREEGRKFRREEREQKTVAKITLLPSVT